MEGISAVIITQNEERNIVRCLRSLQGIADEVVVVDSGSTDQTESLCRAAGARFISHPWEGYSAQKNFADSQATQPWTLSLDADEALSSALRQSLLQLKQRGMDRGTAYAFNRLSNYCGSWIKHCGWYPDRKTRLWPTGAAEWDGVVHEELRFASPMKEVTLQGDLLHYTYYTLQEHAERQVRYAALAAQKANARGKRYNALAARLSPLWTFVRNYVFKGGFLDGHAGYQVCRMSAFYTFMKHEMLKEAQQNR